MLSRAAQTLKRRAVHARRKHVDRQRRKLVLVEKRHFGSRIDHEQKPAALVHRPANMRAELIEEKVLIVTGRLSIDVRWVNVTRLLSKLKSSRNSFSRLAPRRRSILNSFLPVTRKRILSSGMIATGTSASATSPISSESSSAKSTGIGSPRSP